jgi:dTDP-4-dehydrorhamnose reductase
MKKGVLLSGGTGRFATQLVNYNKDFEIYDPTEYEMDVSNFRNVQEKIREFKPDYFIHAGALTKPLMVHEHIPQKSIRINILGTSNVVLACIQYKVKLIYISTDYVYSGEEGNYDENSPVRPFNNYGWSKLGGECAVRMYDNSLIIRVAMNNRPFSHKKALVDFKRSHIFDDEAAKITLRLLDENGIVNLGGESLSVYDFAKKYNPDVERTYLKDIKDVNLPPDTSMNTDKLKGILGDE